MTNNDAADALDTSSAMSLQSTPEGKTGPARRQLDAVTYVQATAHSWCNRCSSQVGGTRRVSHLKAGSRHNRTTLWKIRSANQQCMPHVMGKVQTPQKTHPSLVQGL